MAGGRPRRDRGSGGPAADRPKTASKFGLLLGAALVFLSAWVHAGSIGGGARPESRLPEDDLCCWSNSAVIGQSVTPALRGSFYEAERDGFRPAIRPLPLLFLRMEHSAFGESGAGYQVIQLLLLGATGVLLFLLLMAWWGSALGAAFGAMLFVVHPLTVPAVAGIAGVSNLLALAFLFGGIEAARTNRGAAVSSGLVLLAALCNEMAFAAIPAIGVWAWGRSRTARESAAAKIEGASGNGRTDREGRGPDFVEDAVPVPGASFGGGAPSGAERRGVVPGASRVDPIAVFALGSGLAGLAVLLYRAVILWTLPHNMKIAQAVEAWTGIGFGRRLLVGLAGVFESFRLIVFPLPIGYANDYLLASSLTPLRATAGALLCVVMVWGLLWSVRRAALAGPLPAGRPAIAELPPAAGGLGRSEAFWIAMVFFPMIGASGLLISTGAVLPARALLFVLPGIAGLFAWGVRWAIARRRGAALRVTLTVLGALILGLACWRTIERTRDYRNWEALVQRQTIEFPRSAQGWYDEGNLRLVRGQRAAARAAYNEALTLRPDYWEAWINLGVVYYDEEERGLAMRAFTHAVDGTIGNKALRILQARARFHQGLVYLTQVKNVDAARCFEDMLAVFPDHLYSHANLGMIYSNSESLDDRALKHLERAMQLETVPERRAVLQEFRDKIVGRREQKERRQERISGGAIPGAVTGDSLP